MSKKKYLYCELMSDTFRNTESYESEIVSKILEYSPTLKIYSHILKNHIKTSKSKNDMIMIIFCDIIIEFRDILTHCFEGDNIKRTYTEGEFQNLCDAINYIDKNKDKIKF